MAGPLETPFSGEPVSNVQPTVGELTINWALTSWSSNVMVPPLLIQMAPSVVAWGSVTLMSGPSAASMYSQCCAEAEPAARAASANTLRHTAIRFIFVLHFFSLSSCSSRTAFARLQSIRGRAQPGRRPPPSRPNQRPPSRPSGRGSHSLPPPQPLSQREGSRDGHFHFRQA